MKEPNDFNNTAIPELDHHLEIHPQLTLRTQVMKTQRQLVQFLKTERKRAGLTQKKLSELSGMLQPAISRLEQAEGSLKVETLLSYLQALEINLVEALVFYQQHQTTVKTKEENEKDD